MIRVVPPVRLERTLLRESDFESDASTNSATGALHGCARIARVTGRAICRSSPALATTRCAFCHLAERSSLECVGPGWYPGIRRRIWRHLSGSSNAAPPVRPNHRSFSPSARRAVAVRGVFYRELGLSNPPDVMLIPMILADRAKAWRYAFTCTLASVLGGVFGYLIGAMFFDFVGRLMLELYGNAEKFGVFQAHFEEWGAWAVFFAGITPFPYKVITVASGFIQLNLMIFLIASVLARGMRFFAVAGLLWYFGEPIRALWRSISVKSRWPCFWRFSAVSWR